MIAALNKVVEAGKQHGVYTGMHVGSLDQLSAWMAKGMRLLAYNTNLGLIRLAAAPGLTRLREAAGALPA